MKPDNLSNYEHDSGIEKVLSYIKRKAGIGTQHEESVALKDFFYRLKRKLGETMSA